MIKVLRIFKYNLNIIEWQELELPKVYNILSVQFQGDNLCMWVAVDPDAEKGLVIIRIVGTGQMIENIDNYNFLGTVLQFSGKLVWHVFEKVRRSKSK